MPPMQKILQRCYIKFISKEISAEDVTQQRLYKFDLEHLDADMLAKDYLVFLGQLKPLWKRYFKEPIPVICNCSLLYGEFLQTLSRGFKTK